jgi:energy-coupling factor transport system permease protein
MDPRVKIAIVFFFMLQLFLNHSWEGFGLFTLFLLSATYLSRLPFGYVIRGLRPIIILLLVTLFFNVFFSRGTLLWEYRLPFPGGLAIKITREGLDTGLMMTIRLVLLVFSTSLLTLTTSPIQLTDAMESLMWPLRRIGVPAHELAMMMTISLRFIPVLIEETEKIYKAQRSRGARFGRGGIIQKARSLLPILVPLFVHAFKHAEDLAAAMESRCYRGGEGRTRLRQLRFTWLDLAAFACAGVVLSGAAFWDAYGKH